MGVSTTILVDRRSARWFRGALEGRTSVHAQTSRGGGLLTERQSTYGQIGLSIVQERARGTDVSTQMDKLGSSQPNDGPCVDKWGS